MEAIDTLVTIGKSKSPRRVRLHLTDIPSPPCKGRPDPLSICPWDVKPISSSRRRRAERKEKEEREDEICGDYRILGEGAGCDVVVLCFNVASRKTLERWRKTIEKSCPHTSIVLVGCKVDLREDKETILHSHTVGLPIVSFQEGSRLAKEIGAKCYAECSALTCENVASVFEQVARVALLSTSFISSIAAMKLPHAPFLSSLSSTSYGPPNPPPSPSRHLSQQPAYHRQPPPPQPIPAHQNPKFSVPFISVAATSAPTQRISPLALSLSLSPPEPRRRTGSTLDLTLPPPPPATAEDEVQPDWAPTQNWRLSRLSSSSSLCWVAGGDPNQQQDQPQPHLGVNAPWVVSPVFPVIETQLVPPPRWCSGSSNPHSPGCTCHPFLTPAPHRASSASSSDDTRIPSSTLSRRSESESASSAGSTDETTVVGGWTGGVAGAFVRRLSWGKGRKGGSGSGGGGAGGGAGIWKMGSRRNALQHLRQNGEGDGAVGGGLGLTRRRSCDVV
ncbi:Rho GTPase protein rac1 [Dinochytrium kinnereticum]|nr:Rho GTPase protein rac1 [Dinochytrium kinnereticum]